MTTNRKAPILEVLQRGPGIAHCSTSLVPGIFSGAFETAWDGILYGSPQETLDSPEWVAALCHHGFTSGKWAAPGPLHTICHIYQAGVYSIPSYHSEIHRGFQTSPGPAEGETAMEENNQHSREMTSPDELQLLEQGFNNAQVAIAITDTDRKVIRINPEFTHMFGFAGEEVVGRALYEFMIPEELHKESFRLTQPLRKGERVEFETVRIRKDGQRLDVLCRVCPIAFKGGYFGGFVFYSDITERKRYMRELKERAAFLSRVLETSPIVFAITQRKAGRYLLVNPAHGRESGYSEEEVLGKTSLELNMYVNKADRGALLKILDETGELNNFEIQYRNKDGSVRDVLLYGRPLDYEGEACMLTASLPITERKRAERKIAEYRDHLEELVKERTAELESEITERKRAEEELKRHRDHLDELVAQRTEELRKANEELQVEIRERRRTEKESRYLRDLLGNIINSMPSVLVAVDAEGRIIQWNRSAEKTTGISGPEALGKPLGRMLPELGEVMEEVGLAVRDRKPHRREKIPWEWQGETRVADVTIYPLFSRDMEGAVIRVDDVTERVRMEQMMIQSEKMLSVGGLAAGMAHEINNPLAGIMQNAQVISNRISGDLTKNRRSAEACGTTMEAIEAYMAQRGVLSMLDSVRESAGRAAKIVTNMLGFSRKSEGIFSSHNLCDLMDKTVSLASNDYDLKEEYDFRKIDIIREYDNTVPEVVCEGSQIQQVIFNLLKNGAQAMTKRSQGEDPPRFILLVMRHNGMARIEIQDNGPGMDEATCKRVFEPFFTTKAAGIGTGLGLSVSYFIITQNHGGTMAVESTPGKGTRFIICLPLERDGRTSA